MIKEKHSHIDADEEQKRLLDLEKKYQGKNKALNIVLTASFFAFIYIFALLFWILPDRGVSAEENRALASAPEFSFASLADGSYTEKFATYMADQFPARNFFVNLKAATEAALLKGENNGVIFAKNGYLVKRFDSVDEETVKNNISNICEFADAAKEAGLSVTVSVAGRELDVASSVLPSVYGTDSSDAMWSAIDGAFSESGVGYVDLKTPLKEHFDAGEYVYYKTDHHWTSYGAYIAYTLLADEMGFAPADIGSFRRETATEEFFGTTWSSAGASWISPDTIEFFRFDGDVKLSTDRQDEKFDGLYKTSYLDEKDKYSAFLGGNAARTDVASSDGSREKLLVVKDSFFHSLAPFFAEKYDLVMIDLRYFTGSVAMVCKDEGIENVLILLNAETIGEESGLGRLKMGLSLLNG